jgi:pimeloyl-ACP methyl ester carboxylesterase
MPIARVNDIQLYYEVHGRGFPLVLAHGYTASTELWQDQVAAFSQKYRLVIYDARGHGQSEAPADLSKYSLGLFVEDQRALMEHLGIAEAHVGGLSMGGMIAMRFALRYPQMVRALLLFDTAAAVTGPLAEELHSGPEEVESIVRTQGVFAAMQRFYEARSRMGFAMPQPTPGVLRHIAGLQRMSPDGFLGAGKALREQESVLERLGEIRAPTLVLVGDQDFLLAPSRAMQERLAGCQFVLIKGATHGTCLWRPEAFTQATLDFLAQVDAGQPVAGEREL